MLSSVVSRVTLHIYHLAFSSRENFPIIESHHHKCPFPHNDAVLDSHIQSLFFFSAASLSLSLLPKSFGQHKKQNLRSRGVLVLKVFFRCCEERHKIFFSFFFCGSSVFVTLNSRERERETHKNIWGKNGLDRSLSLSLSLSLFFFFSPLVVHPKPPLLHIPFVSEAFCSRERERERERK